MPSNRKIRRTAFSEDLPRDLAQEAVQVLTSEFRDSLTTGQVDAFTDCDVLPQKGASALRFLRDLSEKHHPGSSPTYMAVPVDLQCEEELQAFVDFCLLSIHAEGRIAGQRAPFLVCHDDGASVTLALPADELERAVMALSVAGLPVESILEGCDGS